MMDIDENANGPSRAQKSNGKLNNQIMEGGRATPTWTPQFITAEGHGPTPSSSTWAANLTGDFGHEFVPRGYNPDLVQTEVFEVLGDEASRDRSSDAYERNIGLYLMRLLLQKPRVILQKLAKWGFGDGGNGNADHFLLQWVETFKPIVIPFANGTKRYDTLIMASCRGFHGVVRYLCTARHGIDSVNVFANAGDHEGCTPLHWASYHGNLEVIKTLLDVAKVDVNKENVYGDTPLNFASWKGHLEVVTTLLKVAEVDVMKCNKYDVTPLHEACKAGHFGVVKALLETEAYRGENNVVNFSLEDAYKETPFSYAKNNAITDLLGIARNTKKEGGKTIITRPIFDHSREEQRQHSESSPAILTGTGTYRKKKRRKIGS